MTKETADTTDLLRRFAEVIPTIPAKAVALMCETTAATIHFRASLLPVPLEPRPDQPSPYATVNVMGHKVYQGEVTWLPGRILRVQSVELSRGSDVVVRVVDVHERAVHSVLWATEAQHAAWRARVDRVAAERRTGSYRSEPLLADEDETPVFIHDEGGEHPAEEDEDAAAEARAHRYPDARGLTSVQAANVVAMSRTTLEELHKRAVAAGIVTEAEPPWQTFEAASAGMSQVSRRLAFVQARLDEAIRQLGRAL